MKIVAVIPALNEEKSIRTVVQETRSHVRNVIVVDDGSTDLTGRIARKEKALVISHHRPMGLGKSMSDGINEALRLGADIIVQLDADRQHNPSEIPMILAPLLEDRSDVVVGSRFLGGNDAGMPWIKRIGNRIFSLLLSRMCDSRITDSQSGFRAYRSEVARGINLISSFSYTQEFLFQAHQNGYRLTEIPVRVEARAHGKSKVVKSIIGYTIRQLLTLFRIYRDYEPLKTFSLVSLLILMGGILFGVAAFMQKSHQMILGLIGLLLIIFSIQLFFFGFLADMIMNVKKDFLMSLRRK
jgi:glycosyltransferase involved in cell wall biosynthesis